MNPDSPSAPAGNPVARFAPAVVRVLMGLPLLAFGINTFVPFMPQPETPIPEPVLAFVMALVNSGYMMQLIGVTFVIVGTFLLINRFVPLALALFAPFIVNSVLFHLILETSSTGRIMSGIFLAMELYLAWAYRRAFAPMLAARVSPT